jgi:hypothetical protein
VPDPTAREAGGSPTLAPVRADAPPMPQFDRSCTAACSPLDRSPVHYLRGSSPSGKAQPGPRSGYVVTSREPRRLVGCGRFRCMADYFGFSLAVLLLIGGIVALIAAAVVHWLLVVAGVVLIAVALYLFVFGGLPGM